MPLSPPVSRRQLKHTRTLSVEAFARDDGLWDIDARITDIKTRVVTLASGRREAGDALHDLKLRITIDLAFNIVAAEASSDAVPYPGFCDTISPAYQSLVGLNLMQGFRHQLKSRVAGIAGCTHLTELAQILPTAAIQAFAGDVIDTRDGDAADDGAAKPFQLDRCHALRTDGAAVAQFYPRWSVPAVTRFQSS
ncbi:hypothetical protein RCH09_002424 [Actimicrobium sp. GrIS 1.19]|uniref:DUF2889 domain-containing protein n=1 Tax=Actimicrobium sp. GrIS 1.19 TaxID=3071708 RepID=UPI002E008922|nr:hypothetical protein [Actimicrobium sp. GrIS 1.19]